VFVHQLGPKRPVHEAGVALARSGQAPHHQKQATVDEQRGRMLERRMLDDTDIVRAREKPQDRVDALR
jgi:hypothetical protein